MSFKVIENYTRDMPIFESYVCPKCGEIVTISGNFTYTIAGSTYKDFDVSLIKPQVICDKCDMDMLEVDPNISQAISFAIKSGMKTAYCCSGHPYCYDKSNKIVEMHPEWEYISSCYIDFEYDEKVYNALVKIVEDTKVSNPDISILLRAHIDRYYGQKNGKQLAEIAVLYNHSDIILNGVFDDEYKETALDRLDIINGIMRNMIIKLYAALGEQ